MRVIADTNVLVRAAVADDPEQGEAAARALQSASQIAVTNPALCEFVWVLSRANRRSPREIGAAIRDLLAADKVVADRSAAEAALSFMEAGGDFADGMIAHEGQERGADVFLSFDRVAREIARKRGMKVAAP